MKVKDYKCTCGCDDFFFSDKGNQIGIYCLYCGKWFKWADKDEQNLRMKQETILDKIRAEIEEIIGEYNLEDYDFCSGLIVARKIIDKYKTESEKKECR